MTAKQPKTTTPLPSEMEVGIAKVLTLRANGRGLVVLPLALVLVILILATTGWTAGKIGETLKAVAEVSQPGPAALERPPPS